VQPARKPWWQQATALVTVSAGGVITGLNFAPGTAATMTTPNGLPLHLLALEKSAAGELGAPAADTGGPAGDAVLRPAIVNIAKHYLQLASTRTPAEMEALIWSDVSLDQADHGPSCAAFASLTLALAAQATGQQSWVTSGGSYPWPVHSWADVRVDPNPDSLTVTSILQDAQAHERWHPLGDRYVPQPGDWVLFHQHVEVVTSYSDGVLHTIGANSPPNFSVNAHSYAGPLANDYVQGFVDNGHLPPAPGTHHTTAAPASKPPAATAVATATAPRTTPPATPPATKPATQATPARNPPKSSIPNGPSPTAQVKPPAEAAIPGLAPVVVPGLQRTGPAGSGLGATDPAATTANPRAGQPSTRGPKASRALPGATSGTANIPGLVTPPAGMPTSRPSSPKSTPTAAPSPSHTAAPKASPTPAPTTPAPTPRPTHLAPTHPAPSHPAPTHTAPTHPANSQQAFISAVAPGAMAAQQRWGVPAAVTIAQAIEESGWGQSGLAANYHNLFGIKGSGPAGSVTLPTQEFENGQWVTIDAPFRAYHNNAESIADHAELLATSGYYTRAMADRAVPDAFANDLTGVYATDPDYGANLIAMMKLYNLYQYDSPAASTPAPTHPAPPPSSPTPTPTVTTPTGTTPAPTTTPTPTPATTTPAATSSPAPTATGTPRTTAAPSSAPSSARGQASIPGLSPVPSGTSYGSPASRSAPRPRASRPAPAPAAAGSLVGSVTTTAYVRPVRTAPRVAQPRGERLYSQPLPATVRNAFYTTARTPVGRAEPMYKQIANQVGISWKLLAACDWMQCQAQPHMSPVHGERLGSLNADGTVYTTKSAALAQCATDLIELAFAVYGIDLTVPRRMSIQALADVFAAFRWGGLLRRHGVSSMEFPYSVEGLTGAHVKMRWPAINEPKAPDKPGTRFKLPFGAVPVVLSLNYRATV
jgi:flagellum-specific peptidoglycan hydrolase FlgJ